MVHKGLNPYTLTALVATHPVWRVAVPTAGHSSPHRPIDRRLLGDACIKAYSVDLVSCAPGQPLGVSRPQSHAVEPYPSTSAVSGAQEPPRRNKRIVIVGHDVPLRGQLGVPPVEVEARRRDAIPIEFLA